MQTGPNQSSVSMKGYDEDCNFASEQLSDDHVISICFRTLTTYKCLLWSFFVCFFFFWIEEWSWLYLHCNSA